MNIEIVILIEEAAVDNNIFAEMIDLIICTFIIVLRLKRREMIV